MKKLFLSLIAIVAGTMGSYAQTNLVATLSHGSSIQEFYGATALSEAYTAAENGDVITLSSGTFNSITLEKAITLRGSGMCEMEEGAVEPTYLMGDFTINVPSETANYLTLENLQFNNGLKVNGENLSSVTFAKCYFTESVTCFGCNALFMSCFFYSSLVSMAYVSTGQMTSIDKNTMVICRNSVIKKPSCDGKYTLGHASLATLELDNCVVRTVSTLYSTTLKNSIILISSGYVLPESATVTKCVAIDNTSEKQSFKYHPDGGNVIAESMEAVFQTLREMDFSREERFLLTEEAAAKYLGNDGTQVGIYGGVLPFNPLPSNSLKKFNVNSSTENGKLKVHIDVE